MASEVSTLTYLNNQALNFGAVDSTTPQYQQYDESVICEGGPLKITASQLLAANTNFILDHPVYGVLSDNAVDGTITGSTSWLGGNLNFAGSDGDISIGTFTNFWGTGIQTLSLWFKPNSGTPATRGFIYSHYGAPYGNRVYLIQNSSGIIDEVTGTNVSNTFATAGTYSTTSYNHILYERDYDNLLVNVYLNGSHTLTNAACTITGTTDAANHIGNLGSEGFNGYIKEVVFYNRSLTSQEKIDIYNGVTPKNGIFRYYKINEGSGTKAYDTKPGYYLNADGIPSQTSGATQYVLNDRIGGKHKFFEHFRETSYIDTAITTATIDTTTDFRVEFTSGQIVQSNVVAKEGTIITTVTPFFTNTGNITFQYANVLGVWNNAVSGTTYAITPVAGTLTFPLTFTATFTLGNPALELYWKATEAGGSTATLSELEIDYTLQGE